jgi:hypothetical protein
MSEFGEIVKKAVEESGGQTHGQVEMGGTFDEPTDNPLVAEGAPAPAEAPKGTPSAPAELSFDLQAFNKKFSKEFDSEEALTAAIEKALKYDEVETNYSTLSQKYQEIESLAKRNVNPLEWFASQDEFIKQQFLKNKANQFSEDALKSLSTLTPSSIDKLNAWEALKLDVLVSNPEIEGGESAVADLLMDKYNVDDEVWESFDVKVKNLIKIDAKSAKSSLKGLYADIKIPEVVDFEESSAKLKEVWSSPLNEISKGIDKIKVAEGLDFIVSEDMKAGLVEEVMQEVLSSRIKPSEETGAELVGKMRSKILERNMDAVVENLRKSIEEEYKAKYRGMVHNSEPLNNGTGEGASDDIAGAINWLLT